MGYSVYEFSTGSFARMAESLRRQGHVVIQVPYWPDPDRMDFEPIETPADRRSILRTKIRGVSVDLFCTVQAESGQARVFARLAEDGSLVPGDIAQLLDLAMVRAGATVRSIERPITRAFRSWKSETIQRGREWISSTPRIDRYPKIDPKALADATRERDELRIESREFRILSFACLFGGMLLVVVMASFRIVPMPMVQVVMVMAFACFLYFTARAVKAQSRIDAWLCPRCGRRFHSTFFLSTYGNRCRHCRLVLPK